MSRVSVDVGGFLFAFIVWLNVMMAFVVLVDVRCETAAHFYSVKHNIYLCSLVLVLRFYVFFYIYYFGRGGRYLFRGEGELRKIRFDREQGEFNDAGTLVLCELVHARQLNGH